jgi:hypothetical protein
MDHTGRLQLIGKVTYYLGWIALLGGGLVHLNIATSLFLSLHLTQRNLFEGSVICFVICVASELRARDVAGVELSNVLKKAA